jgi:hypothetical protein
VQRVEFIDDLDSIASVDHVRRQAARGNPPGRDTGSSANAMKQKNFRAIDQSPDGVGQTFRRDARTNKLRVLAGVFYNGSARLEGNQLRAETKPHDGSLRPPKALEAAEEFAIAVRNDQEALHSHYARATACILAVTNSTNASSRRDRNDSVR